MGKPSLSDPAGGTTPPAPTVNPKECLAYQCQRAAKPAPARSCMVSRIVASALRFALAVILVRS